MTKLLIAVFTAVALIACGEEKGYVKATDAQDAGREFIRASLDGDMKKASFYVLRDSANEYVFNKWRQLYNQLTPKEKQGYRDATIRPVKIETINDSTVQYIYTNSYNQKDTTVIKIVRVNGEWLVDMKEIHSLKH
jgi:hypothetical protein